MVLRSKAYWKPFSRYFGIYDPNYVEVEHYNPVKTDLVRCRWICFIIIQRLSFNVSVTIRVRQQPERHVIFTCVDCRNFLTSRSVCHLTSPQ